MTQRQNLHYKIASQHKLKTDKEYIPKSSQTKLELSLEKGTKEGEAFQALQEKHSQVIVECQLKFKSLVVEAGDLDLIEKKKLTIVSFVESIHDISEGFLTYDECQDITAHQCSVDLVELYIGHLAVHLNASKENLLKEYKKRYEIEEMPTARVTRHQATATPDVSLPAPPAASGNYGQWARRILNKREAAAALLPWMSPRNLRQESNPQHKTQI